ncbi:polyprenyl synthetase family protein [Virgibacillus kimchii]
MQVNLNEYINHYKVNIHKELIHHLKRLHIPDDLKASMLYSVEAGGKRLRPILLIASYENYGSDIKKAMAPAMALELIHTYSLIHDDLPAMDNDDIRRGKPTNHKVFDESTAILAGDALLTYSFEILSDSPYLEDQEKVELIRMLSKAAGPRGMVAGQIMDMEAENKQISLKQLETIHELKTGELLTFSVCAGAFLGRASKEELNHLKEFAYYLGLIFQVQDDILDISGDPEKLGKPTGSDEDNKKSTYPNLLGLDGAIKHKEVYVQKAKAALKEAKADNSYLMALTEYFSHRDH